MFTPIASNLTTQRGPLPTKVTLWKSANVFGAIKSFGAVYTKRLMIRVEIVPRGTIHIFRRNDNAKDQKRIRSKI